MCKYRRYPGLSTMAADNSRCYMVLWGFTPTRRCQDLQLWTGRPRQKNMGKLHFILFLV